MSKLLAAALWYAGQGVPVFPLHPGTKLPVTKNGVQDATTDAAQIEAWWKGTPEANIGGACGFKFDVLDLDEGGEDTLMRHDPLPKTPETGTPSGGTHLLLAPCLVPLKNAVRFAPGLDFRTKGGYIVLPPSKNEKGAWKWKVKLGEIPLAEVPRWIIDQLKRDDEKKGIAAVPEAQVTEGSRNDTLFRHACLQRRFGLSEGEILGVLRVINKTRCNPPLDDSELSQIAKHAGEYKPERVPESVRIAPEVQSSARSGPIGEFITSTLRKGCPSGFGIIDDNTAATGFPAGQMSVVSAYTGGGKSAFMLQCAYNAAKIGYHVCFATFADLTGEDLFDRLVKNLSGWFGAEPPLDEYVRERWEMARIEVKALPIHVHDCSELRSGRDIETFSEWFLGQGSRFDICFVDYAQELRSAEKGVHGIFEHAEVVSASIRWMAAEADVPFVVGSQITEGSAKYGTSDITKGSRAWEERAGLYLKLKVLEDADLKNVDDEFKGIEGLSLAHLAKNRFGIKNLREFWKWDKQTARFMEL